MKRPDWIEFVNYTPTRKRKIWILELIPTATVGNDGEGPVIAVGWLFWTLLIYLPKWE